MVSDLVGLFGGAVALGLVHGVEPGHGWPVAASYAMEKRNKWLSGAAAATVLGVGHLVSSIAMVVVFFAAKSYFDLTRLPWLAQVAGVLLILLGLNELRGGGHHHGHGDDDGHSHVADDPPHGHDAHADHDHDGGFGRDDHGVFRGRVGGVDHRGHDHAHDDHDSHHGHGDHGHRHDHDGHGSHDRHDGTGHSHGHEDHHSHENHSHDHRDGGVLGRLKSALPFVGGGSGSHSHSLDSDPAETSLWSIAWFAFLLGFAHEEEFEILLLCTGSNYCLELMTVYALTVVAGIVGLTLLLVAGYYRYEERMASLSEHFPTVSAAVLILMGLGFLFGVF